MFKYQRSSSGKRQSVGPDCRLSSREESCLLIFGGETTAGHRQHSNDVNESQLPHQDVAVLANVTDASTLFEDPVSLATHLSVCVGTLQVDLCFGWRGSRTLTYQKMDRSTLEELWGWPFSPACVVLSTFWGMNTFVLSYSFSF